jgi:signal peptidase II
MPKSSKREEDRAKALTETTMRPKIRYLLIGILFLGMDILSKWAIQNYLPLAKDQSFYPYGGIGLFRDFWGIEFSLIHATNTGVAWGFLANYQPILLLFRIAVIAVMGAFLVLKKVARADTLPWLLIMAGAIGNVVDTLIYGHVIDMIFLRFWGWPYAVFNLADSYITIGIVWLLLKSLYQRRKKVVHVDL